MRNKKIKGLKKGFTLVELLIVMVIISILVSGTITPFATWAKSSVEDSFKEDLRGVVYLQEKIKEQTGEYVYFDYTAAENDSVIEMNDYRFLVKLKDTRIKIEETGDINCFKLTASRDYMIARFNNCFDSRLYFVMN